jgi:putative transposase
MRYSVAEKAEMIHLIEQSNLPIRQTLQRLDITKSTFYNWLQRFDEDGLDGLDDRKSKLTLPTKSGPWSCIRL